MAKKILKSKRNSEVHKFLNDINYILSIPTPKKYQKLLLQEQPFDLQLLNLSSLYRKSRELYFKLGGKFSARVCSTMRGLSAQDLFASEIDYTPGLSELLWFRDFGYAVSDADEELAALLRFCEISLFHEQNHRVIWRLLPPPPQDQRDLYRYLNFAESLVVTLDLAMADQLGKKTSLCFERVRMIYRPGGEDIYFKKSKVEYRQYLLAVLTTTYYVLEGLHRGDILKAVNYVLPGQKEMNKTAVRRGLQLSEIFTQVTNPQWQAIYWKQAYNNLIKLRANSKEPALRLPGDPLDLESEFSIALRVFKDFGL